MSVPRLFTGDDWLLLVTLARDGQPIDLTGAAIHAAVVTGNGADTQLVVPPVAQSPSAQGADWQSGVVAVDFPSSVTDVEIYGRRMVEIQATIDGRKITWPRIAVEIEKGMIP